MQRVLVIGSCGTGKSTLACELGPRLALPVIHLDREFWRPGWVSPDPDEWHAQVEGLVARDAWVMDGNYSGTLAMRLRRAQAVVWLDLARAIYFPRAALRMIKSYGRVRPDMADGCPERLDLAFLFKWVWNYPTRSRPRVMALLETVRDQLPVTILRSPREVRAFIEGLPGSLDPARR
jgi:adenylate kinase family enzyme